MKTPAGNRRFDVVVFDADDTLWRSEDYFILHQMRKVRASGLMGHFGRVRVVEEKNVETYRSVFDEWSIDPAAIVMIGNSLKSDVLPIMEMGGHGVHVPYHVTWGHEVVHEHDGTHTELANISELPAWLGASEFAQ